MTMPPEPVPAARVRPEQPGDADAIDAVVRAAFAGHPHSDGREPAIVRALRAAGALGLSLVAERDGRVVGHAAWSPVTVDGVDAGWQGLGPVAVSPGHQRLGLGAALVHEGLARLRAQGVAGCVVLGDPAYYRRFGFRAEAGLRYPGPPAEYFMALSFGAPVPAGVVAYHPAFDRAGTPGN